jgi:glycerophosphoryl diester phosphodiesterase
MIVYGHRGASKERPENTLEAFRHALALGADAIETDVHVTRDGAVVVHHDSDGERTAGDARRIEAMTLAEVKAWDVATRARQRGGRVVADAPHRVPTLSDALEELAGVRMNVDVKAASPSAVERVLEVIARHQAEDRVLLTSFHDWIVGEIWRRGYRGELGLGRNSVLLALAPLVPRAAWPRGARVQIPAHAGPLRLDSPRMIERLHSRGYKVDYWVIDDPAHARRLRDAGADGVMCDDVREVVRGLAATS